MAFKKDKYTGEVTNDMSAFSEQVGKAMKSAQAGDVRDFAQEKELKRYETELAKPATDSEIALRHAQAGNFNVEAEGKKVENEILQKTGLRKAEAITGDLENAAKVNAKYREPMAKVGLSAAEADTDFTRERTKNYKDEIKFARLNQGNQLFLEGEQANRNAQNVQTATQKKWEERSNFNPIFSGGSTTSKYIDETLADLGEKPLGPLDKAMDMFPGARAGRAYKVREKARDFTNRTLAKP